MAAGVSEEFVEDKRPASGNPVSTTFDPSRWREAARAALAGCLLLLLSLVLVLVLVATLFFELAVGDAEMLLCALLAPLVGLVGAATGFYYGGGRTQ